jgi:hypothetical protein
MDLLPSWRNYWTGGKKLLYSIVKENTKNIISHSFDFAKFDFLYEIRPCN